MKTPMFMMSHSKSTTYSLSRIKKWTAKTQDSMCAPTKLMGGKSNPQHNCKISCMKHT